MQKADITRSDIFRDLSHLHSDGGGVTRPGPIGNPDTLNRRPIGDAAMVFRGAHARADAELKRSFETARAGARQS